MRSSSSVSTPSAQIAAPVLRAKWTSEPISATLAGSACTSATSERSSLMMSARMLITWRSPA